MKRKNAEEFVKIIQFLMSPDEENWILGLSLLSETSFYKNLNKHTVYHVPCIYSKLGNLNASWDYRCGPTDIKLKTYVQNMLETPPKKIWNNLAPPSVGIVGTILFKLLWDDQSKRTRNSSIIWEMFYQSDFTKSPHDKSKHVRNFGRRKFRKFTYDRELNYYEQVLNSPVFNYFDNKSRN